MTPAAHSFGGRAMDRYILDFETVEAASAGADAGAALSADAAAPGADAEAASSSAATEAAPAWTPDNPAFRDAVASEAEQLLEARLGPLLPLLQQMQNGTPAQQAAAAETLGALDPFADDFGTNLDQRFTTLEQRVAAMLSEIQKPMLDRQEQETIAEGNQRVDDMIADDLTRNGDVTEAGRSQIRALAEAMFPEVAGRYGTGPRAAEVAVARATATIRDLEKAAGDAAVERYKNELGTLSGVRGEPGAATAAVQGLPQVGSWAEAIAR